MQISPLLHLNDDEEDDQGKDDDGKDDKGFLDEDSHVFMTNFERS